MSEHSHLPAPSYRQLFKVFGRIGLTSFGGPAAQIAMMHRALVEEQRWLSERAFMDALSFCMLLPGPEAMQLATYAGWRLRGWGGGLLAGLLFVLPGAALMMVLAGLYLRFGAHAALVPVFEGVKAAVLVIVIAALWKMVQKNLGSALHRGTALLAFLSLFALNLPFPLVVLGAGVLGALTFKGGEAPSGKFGPVPIKDTARTVAIWLCIWWVPILILLPVTGFAQLVEIGIFFSKLATVTFGGAYAVLAYMAQQAVDVHGWLSAEEMLDALGLAETTPGPLILVTEFVGFLAGARSGGGVSAGLGVLAAVVTLWATFAPCFLWVFAGAPYIEHLSTKPRLRAGLQMISAAVVGVIANLSLWFGLHVLFDALHRVDFGPVSVLWPDPGSLDASSTLIAVLSGIAVLGFKRSVLEVLALSALLGWGLSLL